MKFHSPILVLALVAGSLLPAARAQVSIRAVDATLSVVAGDPSIRTVQADGKLLATPVDNAVTRYLPDGTIDPTFPSVPLPLDYIGQLFALPDGSILVEGTASGENGDHFSSLILRLTAGGALDPAFSPVRLTGVYLYRVAVQADGHFLAAISDEAAGGALVRFNADGSRDETFRAGLPAFSWINALTALPNGQILVAASQETKDDGDDVNILARLQADGSFDPTFPARLPIAVDQLAPLASGAALALGLYTGAEGVDHYGLARIDADGSVTPLKVFGGSEFFYDFAPTADGGFLLNVSATNDDGTAVGVVETYDAQGVLASRVSPGVDGYIARLLPRPDGGAYAAIAPGGVYTIASPGDVIYPPPAPGASVVRQEPVVAVKVVRGQAYAGGIYKAKFLLTRTGDLRQKLKVFYSVKGTALSGEDYQSLTGRRVFRAGEAAVMIKIQPVGGRYHRVRSGAASVKLTVVQQNGYIVSGQASGKVHLLNHRPTEARP